ncbi:MAG: ATP-binding cassette domain-containing protein [Pseudomonadota bacterium]
MIPAENNLPRKDAFIVVQDLGKSFGAVHALRGITFSVPRGETMAIIGPSAAGKSVLMKCLVGLYAPDTGRICLDGEDVSATGSDIRKKWAEKTGMLFQHNALFDSLQVWENICFSLIESRKLSRKAARDHAVDLLGLVGLDPDSADLRPSDLSGGMQKRVGIARAIATDPEILLLDNPTAGLDPVLSNHIENMIAAIAKTRGTTVITITNDMKIARDRYQNLAMLHDGTLQWSGPTTAIEDAGNAYLTQMLSGSSQGPITMRMGKRQDQLFA